MKCIQSDLDARNKSETSKRLISKYLEYIEVSKKRFWCGNPAEQNYTTHTSNVLKRVQTSSATSTHVHCFWDGLKTSPKPPRTKSIRGALMPFTPMEQYCRFRWVTVRLIFNISANSWRNATVQRSSSISQTTPTRTSTHLGPKSTTPRLRYHRSSNCPPNWCQRPCYLTSRLWLRPDRNEMHPEIFESNLDARSTKCELNKLISRYWEHIEVSKKRIWPTHQMCLKLVQTSSGTSTHVHCFWDGLKTSPKPPQTKSIRCALMPFTPMEQYCRFRWVTVRLIFNISANSWRNATVQRSSSISQTTPTRTSTHLGPKFTTPRPGHHPIADFPPNWCQRQCYLTSRLWLRPGHCARHSENSLLMPAEKNMNFNALISECLDLKNSYKRLFPSNLSGAEREPVRPCNFHTLLISRCKAHNDSKVLGTQDFYQILSVS